jgi:hypothetical protein
MNGTYILVFRHLDGEFRISYRGDLARQGLVIRCGLQAGGCRLGGERHGTGCDGKTNQKQGGQEQVSPESH